MTERATTDTADSPPAPLQAVPDAPGARLRYALRQETVAGLIEHERAVAQAEALRDAYQAGVCSAMGIPIERVHGLDLVTGELLVDAE